ncbi:unnamed protein product [Echinostoma caproni]|uniref:DUF3506 domain-containing protein n=1 Tax=Echinostoma caproni TaxID=27848 RepID=A0A183A734_9TREM|nr:unnamed protein product [Echinostoma caproni]
MKRYSVAIIFYECTMYLVGTHNSRPTRYVLSTKLDCFVPGKPCHQDYLEISAKLPRSSDLSSSDDDVVEHADGTGDGAGVNELLLPFARICLVNATKSTAAADESGAMEEQQAEQSDDATNGEFVFGHGSSSVGLVFGPLLPAVGLQFTSNLNLLNMDPHHTPGKGILIEYIALFCTPIKAPSGNGLVDYRFRALAHSTVAYAEIFCPPDRWLEPQQPTSSAESFVIPKQDSQNTSNDTFPWWLQRRRHATHICDHHQKSWKPHRIPAACLTESELSAFVANVEMLTRKGITSIPAIHVAPVDTNHRNQTADSNAIWYSATVVPLNNDSWIGVSAPVVIGPNTVQSESRLHTGTSETEAKSEVKLEYGLLESCLERSFHLNDTIDFLCTSWRG